MTVRHNLMNKVKRYIEACHTCLKTKPKYKKNRPIYGRMPIDYAPMQDLSINIKYMAMAFGEYQYLLAITCDQTNFSIVTPLRSRDAQSVAKAWKNRVIYLFGPPRQIICNEAAKFTSHMSCISKTTCFSVNCTPLSLWFGRNEEPKSLNRSRPLELGKWNSTL